MASSFPRGGFDLTALKGNGAVVPASGLTTVSVVNDSLGIGIPGERFLSLLILFLMVVYGLVCLNLNWF